MTNREFEEVYEKYFNDIYLLIKGMSGDKNIAEDITSETFIKAVNSIDNFKGKCDIRIWLCQIAKNTYFSYLKKSNKIILMEEQVHVIDNYDITQIITTEETSMKLHEKLHNLEEPYKEVFSLRVFGELSFKQIGNIFHKTENWACVTYHRAKCKIKVMMEVEDEYNV